MRQKMTLIRSLFAVLVVAMLFATESLYAGPPLICHEVKVEPGKSLPWGKDAFTKAGSYSVGNLTDDVLKILDAEAPVLVRMETLRRATLYLDRNQSRANELMGALAARVLDAEASGKSNGLAWFDAGYFAQCCNQAGTSLSFGPGVTKGKGANGVAGYSWVAKSIAILGSSPELETAAALMTADSRAPEHVEHLKRALAFDAAEISPETARLLGWIAEINGSTIEELRGKHGIASARNNG